MQISLKCKQKLLIISVEDESAHTGTQLTWSVLHQRNMKKIRDLPSAVEHPDKANKQPDAYPCIQTHTHTQSHTHVNTKTSISQVRAPPSTLDCVLWCRRHFLFNIPLSCARKTESLRDITMLECVKISGLTWEQREGNKRITEW